jgi:hypothetical protein
MVQTRSAQARRKIRTKIGKRRSGGRSKSKTSTDEAARAEKLMPLQYSPLRIPYIRLVSITNVEGRLRCTMQKFSLAGDLDFHALSYVWGDSTERQTILVDGQTLKVTQNLFDFLVTASNMTWDAVATPMYWWIDAICINQVNTINQRSTRGWITNNN